MVSENVTYTTEGEYYHGFTPGFGALIRKARKEKGLSVGQLAEELVVSQKTVEAWESGHSLIPVPETVELLFPVLGITPDEVYDAVYGKIMIPRLVPKEEYMARLKDCRWFRDDDIASMLAEERVWRNDPSMCLECFLVLTRSEFSVLLTYMRMSGEADPFRAYEKFISPWLAEKAKAAMRLCG